MKQRRLILALTTVGSNGEAESMARALVDERLAACVNRVAVISTYRWKDAVENDPETLLVIKSTADLVDRLRERVRALSSYEVPEFVVLEPREVSAAYLAWAVEACADV